MFSHNSSNLGLYSVTCFLFSSSSQSYGMEGSGGKKEIEVCTIAGLSGKGKTTGKVGAEVARLFSTLDIGHCLNCHF